MGFQFEQHRLGLWELSWDLKKTISWEMGLGSPPPPSSSRPSMTLSVETGQRARVKSRLRKNQSEHLDFPGDYIP